MSPMRTPAARNLYTAINGAPNLLPGIPRWRRQYTVIGVRLFAAGLTHVLRALPRRSCEKPWT
jgi:hypothetical protein